MLDSLPPRIARKILVCPWTGCWIWCGAKTHNGYAHSSLGRVHRVVYKLVRGPIPEKLELDHDCRTRCCVNPWHQTPMTGRENTLKNTGPTAKHAKKEACPTCGGPYVREGKAGWRRCPPCQKARKARRRAIRRGLRTASPELASDHTGGQ